MPKYAAVILITLLSVALPRAAHSQLLLDDFSTGPYSVRQSSGQDTNTQAGQMVGGERLTVFFVCPPGPCGASNPFDQEAGFQIRPGSPSALIYSAGYKTGPRVDVQYGTNTPLQLNLGQYDRFRVNFDGSDLFVNFNILVFTPSGWLQSGCNLAASTNPVSIDFPFADFLGPGTLDFTNINAIDFIFQTSSAIGANDFAVTSFEAIPNAAPAAQITCHGIGT